jgi:hypothetical protein
MAGPSRRVAGRRRSPGEGDGTEAAPTASVPTVPTPIAPNPIVPTRRRTVPPARPAEPTDEPTAEPTIEPTVEVSTVEPTAEPTLEPTAPPTPLPPSLVKPPALLPPTFGPPVPELAPSKRDSLLVPLIAVGLAVVLLAGALFWFGYLDHRKPLHSAVRQPSISASGVYTPGSLEDRDGAQAVQAAVTALPVVLSYDYRSLPAGIAKAKTYLTSGYGKVFDATYAASVSKVATANKAVVQALVRAAGLVNVSNGSATVLAFVDEALISSNGTTTPTISPDRVKVTLLLSRGKWLIDSVQPF